MSETRFVSDQAGVRGLTADLRGAPVIAIDTEFLTERSYYPRLCLVQIGMPGLLATVDPLACGDLEPLGELFEGPVELVLHAGAQDLTILRRRFGSVPARVFDTQIAAAFLGFGHSISYARLVEACCSVKLKRSRAYSDWARRPLADDQLNYALDDVRYLLQIHQQLTRKLDKRDRRRWADEEFRLARESSLHDADPRAQWKRLSGMRATRRRELAVLRELAAWRELEAQRRDSPRQRILADRVVLEIGRRAPQKVAELEGMRGLHPREQKRSGAAIIAAVRTGLETPDNALPPARKRSRLHSDPDVAVAAALADTYMKTLARELDLAPQLLANRKDLEAIVRMMAETGSAEPAAEPDGDAGVRLLEGWRREVAGNDVIRLLGGQIGLRVKVRRGGVDLVIEDQEGPSPGREGPPS